MNGTTKPSAVAHVFKTLAATYGAAWDRSLGQTPMADVMTIWEYQLLPFTQSREAKMMILWALENLPERCPNVIEFKALCRRAPAAVLPALPEPAADPVRMAAELDKLAPLRKTIARTGGNKDWATRIMCRHQAGDSINMTALGMARSALGTDAA